MELLSTFYDQKYYEDGIASGKSCYVNYRWIPELTIPMAYYIIKELNLPQGARVLDYGCSKGYVVRALRLLGIDAWGVDISEYAIKHCDSEVRDYCALFSESNLTPFKQKFDWVITKDVLEHVPTGGLELFFEHYTSLADNMWHVIPLGDRGVFRIPEYHLDRSHIQVNDEAWWNELFGRYGWKSEVKHHVPGIKDNWADRHSAGNGFFTLSK